MERLRPRSGGAALGAGSFLATLGLLWAACAGSASLPGDAGIDSFDAGLDEDSGGSDDGGEGDDSDDGDDGPESDTDGVPACPEGMLAVEGFCMDRFEAPNLEGVHPLVMHSLITAQAWCAARSKRLCFDDEWTRACAGPGGLVYPYGDTHQAGVCNDNQTLRTYDQAKLNGWPLTASGTAPAAFEEQLASARATSPSGATAADHVEGLYQALPAGGSPDCRSSEGVLDLCGSVEEWTVRRDGGDGPQFTGSLKGRYWAETRTCASAVTSHGDAFLFYETGFRCCLDRP